MQNFKTIGLKNGGVVTLQSWTKLSPFCVFDKSTSNHFKNKWNIYILMRNTKYTMYVENKCKVLTKSAGI